MLPVFLQLVCLCLVVTPLCAAPAASPAPGLGPVTAVKRASEVPGTLLPSASRFTCDKSGIFADQDTGCKVSSSGHQTCVQCSNVECVLIKLNILLNRLKNVSCFTSFTALDKSNNYGV